MRQRHHDDGLAQLLGPRTRGFLIGVAVTTANSSPPWRASIAESIDASLWSSCDTAQAFVAGRMPCAVVVGREPIHVDHQHRQRMPRARRFVEASGEFLVERAPVPDTGESVAQRALDPVLLANLANADGAADGDDVRRSFLLDAAREDLHRRGTSIRLLDVPFASSRSFRQNTATERLQANALRSHWLELHACWRLRKFGLSVLVLHRCEQVAGA